MAAELGLQSLMEGVKVASPSASSLPSLKIMSILLFNMPISKECLWVFGDLQEEGLRGPWYPYSDGKGSMDMRDCQALMEP